MNKEIKRQRNFWNNEADVFQAIYSGTKSKFMNYLDKVFRKDMYERYDFTMKNCDTVSDQTFLDVGCGSGQYGIALAKKGASKVVGIDIAESMLEICRKTAGEMEVRDVCDFLHTDLLAYKPDHKFDVCLGIGLFDYIKDPIPVLRKMNQLSKHKIIVSFPRFWTYRAPIRKLRLWLRRCEVYFFTRKSVCKMMELSGFDKYTITKVGKLHCVIGYTNNTM
ncbi:MAG: class I SAM-dependent methyltransferase [Candidatus Theseobacter exili]|nr:class I SAM-dependent methyltransferase [Candidatus Theseobacter exili]